MGMNYEFERHIKAAQEAKNNEAIVTLQAQQTVFNSLRDSGVFQELPLEVRPIEVPQEAPGKTKAEQRSQNLLRQAVAEYKKGTRTPELITAYWRAKLGADGKKIGLSIEVPDCDWTEEEIGRPMVDIQGKEVPGLMVPVVSEITLPTLGRMYPKMQNYTVREDSPIVDTHDTGGWIKAYASVEAPNLNTVWSDAEEFATKAGYLLGREKTYILGSQASKDLQGRYFDQGSTFSWLSGSRDDDELVCARFRSGGSLYAYWLLFPGVPARGRGWRFEEVKPGA